MIKKDFTKSMWKSVTIATYFLTCIMFSSCQNKDKPIERININTEIAYDSIYSRMPGTLLKLDNYLIWQDPFSIENFIHIIDLKKGQEIGTMGTIGQGPEEFNTPVISSVGNNNIFVFDLNTTHQAFYSIDSLKNNKKPYIRYKDNDLKSITKKIPIGKDQFVILQPSESKRFRMVKDGNSFEFGSPFIEGKDFENKYDINQGNIELNPQKDKFVFASYLFPYIEIYDTKKEDIPLLFSSSISPKLYKRIGTEIKKDPSRRGCLSMTLTKEYIVTIQRDYEVDDTDESTVGMDFNKLPQTLFLYDYNGNMKRIVNVGIPVFNLIGDIKRNTVYVMGVDPEFVIIKCEL